uniref:Uncharacterized protein n=1 Tax=uncultured Caudovirales phage TaxID=2100421 RepID=A0A6J5L966_9CAUD|nr:hypothetical protein UFOVP114_25 [uncultured Caudovirales phage]
MMTFRAQENALILFSQLMQQGLPVLQRGGTAYCCEQSRLFWTVHLAHAAIEPVVHPDLPETWALFVLEPGETREVSVLLQGKAPFREQQETVPYKNIRLTWKVPPGLHERRAFTAISEMTHDVMRSWMQVRDAWISRMLAFKYGPMSPSDLLGTAYRDGTHLQQALPHGALGDLHMALCDAKGRAWARAVMRTRSEGTRIVVEMEPCPIVGDGSDWAKHVDSGLVH